MAMKLFVMKFWKKDRSHLTSRNVVILPVSLLNVKFIHQHAAKTRCIKTH